MIVLYVEVNFIFVGRVRIEKFRFLVLHKTISFYFNPYQINSKNP